uniref:PAAR domain-containing protein n=1 Tax=unclassified Variovorax TaxID=663243 RepID=UPI000D3B40F8
MSDIGRVGNDKDGGPKGIIYQGDMTSHGGVVVGASGHMTKADGKANARVGDIVTCPQCMPHVFPIVTGDETVIDWGVAVPRHGDKTGCGASLISKAASADAISAAMAMKDMATHAYDEQARLEHEAAVGLPYYIEVPDGRTYSGRIGDDKYLPRVSTSSEDVYEIFWGDEALEKMNSDPA